MMRRFLILLLTLLLAVPAALAEGTPTIELDSMTAEELLALHSALTTRIAVVSSGDVVYDEDGIIIVWNGLLNHSQDIFKIGCTIYNNTGRDLRFKINAFGVNGIQIGPNVNTSTGELLLDGMAYYTGSYSFWMVKNVFGELNMTHAEEISLRIAFREADRKSGEDQVIQVRFPVDIDLSEVLR